MWRRINSCQLAPHDRGKLADVLKEYRERFEQAVDLPVEQIEISLYYLLYDLCEELGLSDYQKCQVLGVILEDPVVTPLVAIGTVDQITRAAAIAVPSSAPAL